MAVSVILPNEICSLIVFSNEMVLRLKVNVCHGCCQMFVIPNTTLNKYFMKIILQFKIYVKGGETPLTMMIMPKYLYYCFGLSELIDISNVVSNGY